MVCLEKMLNFDDFTSLNFSYILGTGIRLLLSNPSPSAPYSPDRVTTTPNNTQILQTQTTTTQSQNLPFLETNSPASDSCDELLTSNVQDTSSIIKRPPLPHIPTTRTLQIPEPDSVLQYISSCSQRIPYATKTIRKTPIPTLSKNTPTPSACQTPIKTILEHTTDSPSDISSLTFSQLYPKLERLKSSTTPFLTDLYHKDKDSDSTASTRVPRHSYNLRSQPGRVSQELSTLTSSS